MLARVLHLVSDADSNPCRSLQFKIFHGRSQEVRDELQRVTCSHSTPVLDSWTCGCVNAESSGSLLVVTRTSTISNWWNISPHFTLLYIFYSDQLDYVVPYGGESLVKLWKKKKNITTYCFLKFRWSDLVHTVSPKFHISTLVYR